MQPKIYWIAGEPLAIGPCPPGRRRLASAIEVYRQSGVDILVSLQTEDEADFMGLAAEERIARAAGLQFMRFPIRDHDTPPFDPSAFTLIETLAAHMDAGRAVLVHCYAGIGRSSTIAGAVLVARGYSVQDALGMLWDARGLQVPETDGQRDWIQRYAERHRPD